MTSKASYALLKQSNTYIAMQANASTVPTTLITQEAATEKQYLRHNSKHMPLTPLSAHVQLWLLMLGPGNPALAQRVIQAAADTQMPFAATSLLDADAHQHLSRPAA